MTLFVLFAATLLLLALVFLLPPMLRKRDTHELDRDAFNVAIARDRLNELKADREAGKLSEDEFQMSKEELEVRLASELAEADTENTKGQGASGPIAAGLVALVIVGVTGFMYMQLGAPQGIGVIGPGDPASPIAGQQAAAQPMGPDGKPLPPVDVMLEKLVNRLEQDPENVDGWIMLGRSYSLLNRWTESAEAWRRVHVLTKNNPDVMLSYAEALGMAQGGSLNGKPTELAEQALALNPEHPQGLWFSGLAASERKDWALASKRFRTLWPMTNSDPEAAGQLKTMIEDVERQGGIQGEPLELAVAASKGIQVEVALDPALRAQVQPEDTVFIFARAMAGPPMPLAAVRKQVKDLPLTVMLSDEQAMMPQMKLSNFPQVLVGARVSKSGNAIPASGDFFGEVSPVDSAGAQVVVSIDQKKP